MSLPSYPGRAFDILIGMQRELFVSFPFLHISFYHFHVVSVPFYDHFVFMSGPLYRLNACHVTVLVHVHHTVHICGLVALDCV